MKNRDIYWRRYKKHCTQDNDASVPFEVGTLGPHTLLPFVISCPLYFPESHWWSEISSLSKMTLVLGKVRSGRATNLGCRVVVSHLCDLMFCQKTLNKMRYDAWADLLSWWSCQSPVAHRCSFLNHRNSFQGGMFELNTKFEADLLLYSLNHLNAMATHLCSLNGIYHHQWLVQWSCHCSCMHIPVHSPWLPGYINITQTILVILTMIGPFLDRSCLLLIFLFI